MLGRVLGLSIVIASVVLVVLFQTTTPSTAGPLGVLCVFIFSYKLVLSVLTYLLYGLSKVWKKALGLFNAKRPHGALSLVKSYYFSSVLALGPLLLIGMQSVGKIEIYDVLLVVIFMVVACFYVAKRTI